MKGNLTALYNATSNLGNFTLPVPVQGNLTAKLDKRVEKHHGRYNVSTIPILPVKGRRVRYNTTDTESNFSEPVPIQNRPQYYKLSARSEGKAVEKNHGRYNVSAAASNFSEPVPVKGNLTGSYNATSLRNFTEPIPVKGNLTGLYNATVKPHNRHNITLPLQNRARTNITLPDINTRNEMEAEDNVTRLLIHVPGAQKGEGSPANSCYFEVSKEEMERGVKGLSCDAGA